jgi:SNF2 family DNA or RNA helicase
MPLYHSHLGLFDFQAEGVARCYFDTDNLAVWSTGIGKTHLAMALSAILFEDAEIDHVVVVVEVNKLLDWVNDYKRFTDLSVLPYKGDPKRRERIRANLPQVLVGTYDTMRNDAASKGPTKRHDWVPGPLTQTLVGKRVLVVYDEVGRIGNRDSGIHKAQECLVKHLRRSAQTRTLGLTATPIDRDPVNVYDQSRIIVPGKLGTWESFRADHITSYDIFEKPNGFHNTGQADWDGHTPTIRVKLGSTLKVKQKSDPDVRDQFPKKVEEFEAIELGTKHLDFYRTVREAFYEQQWNPQEERRLFVLLRQIAGHPLALRSSQGELAQMIWEQIGDEGLRSMGAAKLDYLTKRLHMVCRDQGDKAIVFTFFGQSVLPIIHEHLRAHGFEVVVNHGQMKAEARQESIDALRYGKAQVFLSSDAGSRGLNLPEATYVFNYELPLAYANYVQRSDRVHRIDSLKESVVVESLIAAGTIEEPIADLVLRRNEWHDALVGDPLDDEDAEGAHLTAADRRRMIEFAKSRLLAA